MPNKVAYLSAEFAVSPELPIFAGGLGVLAADTLYQASDLGLPLVGVALFYRAGCFNQWLDEEGNPKEECIVFDPQDAGLVDTGVVVEVPFPDRAVSLKVWKREVGESILYLLDSDIPQNSGVDRTMASRLYDGRVWPPHIERSFLMGVGAVRALRELGEKVALWHINDDHTGFSILERIRERVSKGEDLVSARAKVKEETIYTTHTPSLGAESIFKLGEIRPLLKALFREDPNYVDELCTLGDREREGERRFSLTVFSMRHSRVINAVSQVHEGVSRDLWNFVWLDLPEEKSPITYVTNGIYPKRWVAKPLASLYKRHLAADWEQRTDDPDLWKKIKEIPSDIFWEARLAAKEALLTEVHRRTGEKVDPHALILGFARRFVEYKQPTLLVSDRKRLASILCDAKKPVYLLMAGKVHPQDSRGKKLVRTVVEASKDPALEGHLVFLQNYNLDLAHLLVSGSDVWLNTPIPGHEACGTSGMKALYNGVFQAGTLDGWWAEAFNGRNGWEVKGSGPSTGSGRGFADSLYNLLEGEIVPLYYKMRNGIPEGWLKRVGDMVADLAPRFTTARMLKEYKEKIYGLD